jgi:hypothetical protein
VSSFTTELVVRKLSDGLWEVREPFEFHLGAEEGPEFVDVPVGFITDFASIPRILWPFLPPTGNYGKAAVIHDKLYVLPIILNVNGTFRRAERGDADRILREGMEVLEIGWFTRKIIYLGVRTGGWLPWRKYREAEANAGGNAACG